MEKGGAEVRPRTVKPGSSTTGTGVGSPDLNRTWMPYAVMAFDVSETTVAVPILPSVTTVTPSTAIASDHAVVHPIEG